MKYTGLRARIRALEAGLGTNVTKIVIVGGLPEGCQGRQPLSPLQCTTQDPHPPRLAGFPTPAEPSD